ncbi:MAG: hypothetical protein V2A76_11395 [Planctomycetota bacterium]
MTIYLDLTREFNEGRLRAIICSGQAVVLHRLAIMSKDGDWILREQEEALSHVLSVLAAHGARYRFGAPLDVRWMAGGWSSHLEFRTARLRVRTDFFTRPPRITAEQMDSTWAEQEGRDPPFVDAKLLAELKKTNREKDYAVIGELARIMPDIGDRFLYSRSARDLIALAERHPDLAIDLARKRPVLSHIASGREPLEAALDGERRSLIRANERRLERYLQASRGWADIWPDVVRQIENLPLLEAHKIVSERADAVLPHRLEDADGTKG